MADGEDSAAVHDKYDALTHRFENEGGYDMVAEVEKALSGLGFDKADFERPLRELSGGQKNRAMLARAILSSPDVLLLDEPTNHLDFHAVEFLEEYLARSRRAYLVVTHDRRFLDRVAEEIVDLENGRLTAVLRRLHGLPAPEGRARARGDPRLREAAGVHREGEGIHPPQHRRRQLAAGQGPPDEARAAWSVVEKPTEDTTRVAFQFDAARIGGRTFLRAKHLDAGYEGVPIIRDVSFELLRGERLAILGENGTGKTTLLKTLAGRLPAARGERLRRATTSRSATTTRSSRDLDPTRRAIDAVWDEHPDETEEAMRSYLARFAFRGDDVFAEIAGLSGGEKGRLTLAVVMQQRHNLLLLDEPTNHLDLDSREALEESLEDFPGSIVFVSHDRAFIDRLATRVLDLRGGRAIALDGNYSETADARARRRDRPEPPFAAPSAPAPAKPVPAPAPPARPRRPVPRDSESAADKEAAKRRRRIRSLEEKIAALEKEVEAIETRLWEEALTLGPVEAHAPGRREARAQGGARPPGRGVGGALRRRGPRGGSVGPHMSP